MYKFFPHADNYRQTDVHVNRNTDWFLDENIGMTKMTLGERLKEARDEAGLTQTAAAKAAKMSQPNLSELENDEYPTSSFLPVLAEIYGVEPLWLSEGRGPKKRKYSTSDLDLLQKIKALSPAQRDSIINTMTLFTLAEESAVSQDIRMPPSATPSIGLATKPQKKRKGATREKS